MYSLDVYRPVKNIDIHAIQKIQQHMGEAGLKHYRAVWSQSTRALITGQGEMRDVLRSVGVSLDMDEANQLKVDIAAALPKREEFIRFKVMEPQIQPTKRNGRVNRTALTLGRVIRGVREERAAVKEHIAQAYGVPANSDLWLPDELIETHIANGPRQFLTPMCDRLKQNIWLFPEPVLLDTVRIQLKS